MSSKRARLEANRKQSDMRHAAILGQGRRFLLCGPIGGDTFRSANPHAESARRTVRGDHCPLDREGPKTEDDSKVIRDKVRCD